MAITVSTTPHTSDTASSLSISFSGATTGSNITTSFELRINGTTVQTGYSSLSSGSISFTPVNVKSSIWAAASGSSLSGAVSIKATNYRTTDNVVYGTTTKTGGNLTINTRLSSFTKNNANINLDGNSYIKGSWTNPNTSYFRGYFVATMSGGTVGSAGGQNTYYDYNVNPGTSWYNNANSFLGSSSSATITYTLYTQFNTGSWTTQGGSVGSYTGTVTKTQYYWGTLNSVSDFTLTSSTSISYSATDGGGGSGLTYAIYVTVGGVVRVTREGLSSVGSSITLTTEEINGIRLSLAGASSGTATVTLRTFLNGTSQSDSTRTCTTYNVVANISSFTNTERSGTSLSYAWQTDVPVSEVEYKIGDGVWVTVATGISDISGTFQITDLSPSTSYTVYLRVTHAESLQYTTSSGLTVMTVNTSTIISEMGFSLAPTTVVPITISKVNSSMMHTVYLKNKAETITYKTFTNIDSSANLTLTDVVNTLYAATPNSNTLELYFVLESLLNGVSQGFTKKLAVATVVQSNPTLAGATYVDSNTTIQAILLNNQKILQGKSTLKVTATTMQSIHSATLSSLVVSIGSTEYSVAISGTSVASQELTVGVVNPDNVTSVIVKVIDSRGNASTSYELPIQFIPYKAPYFVEGEIKRVNNYYADAYYVAVYEINSVITSSIQRNNVVVQYRYKLQSSSTWGSWINVTNPTASVSGDKLRYSVNIYAGSTFDMNSVYTVESRISDTFTTTPVVRTSFIPKGMGHLEFYEDYVNFGVRPYYTDSEGILRAILYEGGDGLAGQNENLTVTVGSTGDYTTINEALIAVSALRPQLIDTTGRSPSVTIDLQSGFIMSEQVLIERMDLGYITISSSYEITINRSALTTSFGGGYPAFGGLDGAKLPVINVVFNMNTSGTATDRWGLTAQSNSSAVVKSGKGFKNCGSIGIFASKNATVVASGANVSGAIGYGMYANEGATIQASGANATSAGTGFVVASGGVIHADSVTGTLSQPTNAIRPAGIIYAGGTSFRQPTIFKKKASDPDPDGMLDGDILVIYQEPVAFTSTNFPQEFGTGIVWGQVGVWPTIYTYWTSMASTSNTVIGSFQASAFKGDGYPSLIFDGNSDWNNNVMVPIEAVPATMILRFNGSVQFNSFTLTGWAQGHEIKNSPKSFAFFGSNDGETWTTLYNTLAFADSYNTSVTANMSNTGMYFTYLKLVWRTNQDDNSGNLTNASMIAFRELKFNASGVRYV